MPAVQYTQARDGTRIAYTASSGDMPPFLFVNTTGAPPISLRSKLAAYSTASLGITRGRAFAAFDWRGGGQSDPAPPASIDELVQDLEAVTGVLGSAPDVICFGPSCFPACRFAAEHPTAWRSMILCDPTLRFDENYQAFFARPGWEADHVSYLRAIGRLHWQLAPDDDLEAFVQEWARQVPASTRAAYFAVERMVDLVDVLPAIQIPVLVTNLTGSEASREVAAHLPRGILLQRPPGLVPVATISFRDYWDRHIGPLVGGSCSSPPLDETQPDQLSAREQEVLTMLAQGYSNAEIAAELVLSSRTVERHVQNIYNKLGVHNRVEAANWAQRNGLDRGPA